MAAKRQCEIAVIGAGIVGLTVALRLQDLGHNVLVIEPNQPGSGASYGNASSISPHAISPVISSAVLKSLPNMLLSPNSPLSIRPLYLTSLMPWLLRGLMQGGTQAYKHNETQLAQLQTGSMQAWREVIDTVGLQDLLLEKGILYTYPTAASLAAAASVIAMRRKYGVEQEVLSAAQVAALEPNLPAAAGGLLHSGSISLRDVGAATGRLAAYLQSRGVEFLAENVDSLERDASGLLLTVTSGTVRARRAILAAGAHSAVLARQAGDRIPLIAHRGYHIEFDMGECPISRPVHRTQLGYYMTPLDGRLRSAGTVELASNNAAPSEARFAQIERGTRATFANLPAVSRKWMGLRPALPDSLPVIGPSRLGSDVIYAFGHGHIGLTLGPVTAQIVEQMLQGNSAPEAYRAFSAQRF